MTDAQRVDATDALATQVKAAARLATCGGIESEVRLVAGDAKIALRWRHRGLLYVVHEVVPLADSSIDAGAGRLVEQMASIAEMVVAAGIGADGPGGAVVGSRAE
jgi:hypothetical protein